MVIMAAGADGILDFVEDIVDIVDIVVARIGIYEEGCSIPSMTICDPRKAAAYDGEHSVGVWA